MILSKSSRFLSGILIAAVLMSSVPVNVYAETGEALSENDQDAKSINGWIGGSIDNRTGIFLTNGDPVSNWYQYNMQNPIGVSSPTDGDGDENIFEYCPYYETKDNSKGKIYKDYIIQDPGYYALTANAEIFLRSGGDEGKLTIELYSDTSGTGTPINSSTVSSAGFTTEEWHTLSINSLSLTADVKRIRFILEATAAEINNADDYIDFDGLSMKFTKVAAPPIITNLGGNAFFTEGSLPVYLDSGSDAAVTVDTAFGRTYAGGSVDVSIISGSVITEDELKIGESGGITLTEENVKYLDTVIGTYTGGSSGTNLTINLNSNADNSSVTALLRAIVYNNKNNLKPSTMIRTIRISVEDNTGISGNADVTVTVNNINYRPVRKSGITNTGTDQVPVKNAYHLDLSTIFEDPDTDSLTYKVKVNNSIADVAQESYEYIPQTAGVYTLEFTANDGMVDSADTYTVTLTALNTAPVRKSGVPASDSINMVVNTAFSLNLNDVFEDADSDTLSYKVKINGQTEQAAVSSYSYTPTATGTYTLEFKANDGHDDSADTYTVTLNAVAPNTPPARKTGVSDTKEETVPVKKACDINLNEIFEDANGDSLSYKVKVNGGAETAADGNYSYTPSSAGTHTLVFRAYDGSADSIDTYTVILTAVNTPPVRRSEVGESISDNVTIGKTYALDLSTIFEDENQDPLTYKVKIDGGTEETVSMPYSINPTISGTYTLVFKAYDGFSDSTDTYTVILNVKEPNRTPARAAGVEESESITIPVNSSIVRNLANIFEDPDGDPLTYKVKVDSNPEVAANGNFTYIVPAVGAHTLVFKANDGTVDSTQTYTVYITATKDPVKSVTAPNPVTGVTNGAAKTAAALHLPEKVVLVTEMGTVLADVTWDVTASSYDPDQKTEQTFDVEGTVSLPDEVYNPDGISLDVTVTVTVKAEVLVDKVLESISPLSPVTGVPNGTAKTAAALGLPVNVDLETDNGTVPASVTWDVASSSYDPDLKTVQTFEVEGTVTLPAKVINPDSVSLDITVEVTVDAESLNDKILEKIYPLPSIKGITNGTAKTVTALGIPSRVTLGTDAGNVQADVIWDLDSSSYDPFISEEQTFTVEGNVVLPDNVINPSGISLEVTINLTVSEEEEEQEYYTIRINVTKRPDKVSYTLGEDLDTQGLEVTEYQKASPSNAVKKTVLSEGQYDLEYNLTRTGTRTVKVIYYGTDRYGNEKEFTDEFTVRVKEPPRDDSDDDDDREITQPGKPKGGDDDHYYSGSWHSDENGWRINGNDGNSPANRWVYTDWKGSNDWYFFDEKGYMVTGWLEYKGNKYYLNPVSDGKKGYMYTGWNMIEGKWYYFSEAADETKGSMLKDTTTPDGHRVGPDGERIS